jgi:hypothetical protein
VGFEWVDTGSGPGWPLNLPTLTEDEKARLKDLEPKDPPEDETPQ